MLDYIRIACAVPSVKVADPGANAEAVCRQMAEADGKGCDLVVFPELVLTGYSCADLFFQDSLLRAAQKALASVVRYSGQYHCLTAVVGLPVSMDGQLYNCAAVIRAGEVQGLVPKTFIPDYGAFVEKRWFESALALRRDHIEAGALGLDGRYSIPVGAEQTFCLPEGAVLGVEICEDLWAPVPPSTMTSLTGAEVIVNLAASDEQAGKSADRQELVRAQSNSACCVYAFCSAGSGESTQSVVFSGHTLIAQAGAVLEEKKDALDEEYMLVTDADLGVIRAHRSRNTTFRDSMSLYGAQAPGCTGECMEQQLRGDGSLYSLAKLPFIPGDKTARQQYCREVFNIQVEGLKHRLQTIGAKAVIGISGGLDSTLALLVAVEANRRLGRPAADVHGITMPCFGTSDRTYNNAWELMRLLGITAKEISIKDAVSGHFRDIGHDPAVHDTTYENAQARERTQILMDYAGRVGGIVIGTGDLSELALGWCTYNGDHMSMYGVNGSVPKTLIRWVIEVVAQQPEFAPARHVLQDVLDTPISPELLPPDAAGKISQQTEDIVGPYALHDFFLYHMVRYGFAPRKIYTMACRAFREDFDTETVRKWLKIFYRRFFTQQFKRNCQPDGISVGCVGLNPHGQWRMPSDATAKLWLEESEAL